MAVDASPFDGIVVDIAPGANPAASPSTFLWEYAGKRRNAASITVTAGRDDEASTVEAGSLGLTFDDRDANLSPRNILGQWYGGIVRGTPARLRWDRTSDAFTRTVSGSWGTNPDGFAWSNSNAGGTYATNGTQATAALPTNNATRAILGGAGSPDVEVVWSTTLDVLPTGAAFISAALFRHTDVNNYIRAHLEMEAAGTISVKVQRLYLGVQTTILNLTSAAVTYSAGQKVWAKARADGPYIMVKVWTGALVDEPDAWQGATTDDAVDGSETGLFLWRINTNAGTYTAKIDDFAITNILWSGNVPEWAPRWPSKSGADSTTPVTAAGILRRLQQGSSALMSPLRRQLSGLAYGRAYIPAEDGSTATSAASGLSRGKPASVIDGTFAGDDSLPGASTSIVLNTQNTSKIIGSIPGTDTGGYSGLGLFKLATLPAGDQTLMEINATGTVTKWVIFINATAIGFKGYDRTGVLTADATALMTGVVDPTEWFALQLETQVSGGTVNVALDYHQVGSVDYFASVDSYAGTATRQTSYTVIAATDSMSVGHLWFGTNELPFVDDTFSKVSNGYIGEQAGDRVRRLCGENGVPVVVMDGDTEPMGRQKTAKLVDLLRECEAADQGVLYERGLSLAYLPRVRRYNVPVAMALSWPGLFDEPPEPQDDDQRLRNQWTVSRTDGSSSTVTDADSVEAHGLYDDQVTLNIESDDRLLDFAAWLVNLGTNDELRWPRLKINLIKHPELIPAWLSCRVGSRITVSDPPDTIAGEVIDLIIEGYTQTINLYEWTIELSCSPARPWEVGVYDDATIRYDAVATVESARGETETACGVIAADRNGFYSSTSCPYDVIISGQRNTVIGMSLPDSVAIADGTFETYDGLGGWFCQGATTALPIKTAAGGGHRGQYAVTATVTGSPGQTLIRPANATSPGAAPGQTYTVTMWVKCSTSRNVTAVIDYLNAGVFFASDSTTTAVVANTWTQLTVSGTCPASTTQIQPGPTLGSSPANGVVLTLDDLDIVRTDAQNSRQLAALERGVDGFTKALPTGASFRIANPARYAL